MLWSVLSSESNCVVFIVILVSVHAMFSESVVVVMCILARDPGLCGVEFNVVKVCPVLYLVFIMFFFVLSLMLCFCLSDCMCCAVF